MLENPSSSSTSLTIIGAGPAGMTAALFAAKNGIEVALIDANSSVGRKLLVTGSGRANLTNHAVRADKYHSSSPAPAWLESVFSQFGPADLERFLEAELGLLTYATADGWVYPVSESAHSVAYAFASALERAGVHLLLDHRVTSIRNKKDAFVLSFEHDSPLTCPKLLLAAGGKAYPTLGSRGDWLPWLSGLGHTVLPLVPALGPLSAEMGRCQALQGVRLDVRVSLFEGARLLDETTGNLIFTQWGLNGPAVMDLSHWVARRPSADWNLRLNFLPSSEEKVRSLIQLHRRDPYPLAVLPGASLPPKLTAHVLSAAGLAADARLNQLNNTQLETLLQLITAFPLQVTGVRGFDTCQVSAGGVPPQEVDPLTMQSRLVPGLYLAGEILDVVGPCGGYNLQFAFSTGAVAGKGISKEN